MKARPSFLYSFLLAASLLAGCGGGGSSGSSGQGAAVGAPAPDPPPITVDTLAPVATEQGERIAGARVNITALDRTVLATAITSDASLATGLSVAQTIAESGRVSVSFSATLDETDLCLVTVEGGDYLSEVAGGLESVSNDTAPQAILPCWALDSGLTSAAGVLPEAIELGKFSSAVVRTIALYTDAQDMGPGLGALLDQAAASIPVSANVDLNQDGSIAYLELLAAPEVNGDYTDAMQTALRLELANELAIAPTSQPNIVLIVADDLGYGDVSSFWSPGIINTPSIDSIAASGVALTNFHVYPVCASSRAALFSGRFVLELSLPGTGGPASAGIPRSAQTIPEYLQALGYNTAAVGKWHLSSRSGFRPHQRGFQEWMGFYGGVSFYAIDEVRDLPGFTYYEGEMPFLPDAEHATDAFADRAIDYIRQRHDAPFFLYVGFNAPHTPLWTEAKRVFSAPERWLEQTRSDSPPLSNKRLDYVALVRHMDARIGDMLSALEEEGLSENTLVMFTSDNGADTTRSTTPERPIGSNAFYRGGKASAYEGGIRVPFMARWPGVIPVGHNIDEFTTLLDLWPTLREVAGSPVRDDEQRAPRRGASLLPLLNGAETALPANMDRTAHFGFTFVSSTVVRYPWKLVREDGDYLFNLSEDPTESNPLNDTEPERLADLIQASDLHRQR